MSKRLAMAAAMLASVAGCAVQSGYETDEVYGYPTEQPYYYGPAYGTVYGGTIWYQDGPDRRPRYVDRNRNGIPDYREMDRNHNGIPDVREADRNHNGIPDAREGDRNRNGIPDNKEAAPIKAPEKPSSPSRLLQRTREATANRTESRRDQDGDGRGWNRRDDDRR